MQKVVRHIALTLPCADVGYWRIEAQLRACSSFVGGCCVLNSCRRDSPHRFNLQCASIDGPVLLLRRSLSLTQPQRHDAHLTVVGSAQEGPPLAIAARTRTRHCGKENRCREFSQFLSLSLSSIALRQRWGALCLPSSAGLSAPACRCRVGPVVYFSLWAIYLSARCCLCSVSSLGASVVDEM